MITSGQLRAARALLGIDQRTLAEMAGVSVPTIQRMEVSDGQVRGVIDTLVKVVAALEGAGIEILGDNTPSLGAGRGVRLRDVRAPDVRAPDVRGSHAKSNVTRSANDGLANAE